MNVPENETSGSGDNSASDFSDREENDGDQSKNNEGDDSTSDMGEQKKSKQSTKSEPSANDIAEEPEVKTVDSLENELKKLVSDSGYENNYLNFHNLISTK